MLWGHYMNGSSIHQRLSRRVSTSFSWLWSLFNLSTCTSKKKPHGISAARDKEARGKALSPDPPGFPLRFEQELHKYCSRRKHLPQALASLKTFSASEKHAAEAATDLSPKVAGDPDARQEFLTFEADTIMSLVERAWFMNVKTENLSGHVKPML